MNTPITAPPGARAFYNAPTSSGASLNNQPLPQKVARSSAGRAVPQDAWTPEVFELKNWRRRSARSKLRTIRDLAESYGVDPKMGELAHSIIVGAGVQPRDYLGQAQALLSWVQNNIYYINEPDERLQTPWYTIQHRKGDCFAEDTLVLRDDCELVPIQDIQVGERIWGRDRWSVVEGWVEKGQLAVTEVALGNGSVLRLTEDHKVYVVSCAGPKLGEKMGNGKRCDRDHGPACSTQQGWYQCVKRYGTKVERIRVSELREGMELLQPDIIERDLASARDHWIGSPQDAWAFGAFIADGWSEAHRVSFSGLDGFWKESTKHRVERWAARREWTTTWNKKYITVNGREAAMYFADCGKGALNKRIPHYVLESGDLEELDEGLKLDASQNTHGEGWTFGTISRQLAVQYRVLQRMLGRSTSMRCVTNHGGYGSNPIYRVGVRATPQRLTVKAIHREVEEVPCYDIQTDDHYVYLPEADCTVSNCDDVTILLGALLHSVALPWRSVLAGHRGGRVVHLVEFGRGPLMGANWSHIYMLIGNQPFKPTRWYAAEPTMKGLRLGQDITRRNGGQGLPELAGWQKYDPRGEVVPLGQAPITVQTQEPTGLAKLLKKIEWTEVTVGVIQSVITALLLAVIFRKRR